MGKWKTWGDGEKIPYSDATSYEDVNHWLDYRDYSDDTHASGWGASEKGRLWWNTTDLRYKFWDGSAVQTLPGSTSGVSLPFVVVDANDGADLVDKWDTYITSMPIWVPPGTYALTDELQVTLATDIHPHLIGAGSKATTLTSSETNVVEVLNTAFPASGSYKLTLQGFTVQHTMDNTNDITLDLKNAQANLYDVDLLQQSATEYGMGIDSGQETAQAPNGQPCTWQNVQAYNYEIGMRLGLDHLCVINGMTYGCENKAFEFESPADTGLLNITGIFLQSAPDPEFTTQYPFWFHRVSLGVKLLFPNVEATTKLTHELFYMDSTNVSNYKVEVIGGACNQEQDDNLCNDWDRFVFIGGNRLAYQWRKGSGSDTTPLDDTTPTNPGINEAAGDANPTSATDYEVHRDCYLTWTDSGGADNVTLIKDYYGGNTIATLSNASPTLPPLLKAGQAVRWTFTGAAPDVTAFFV